MNMNFLTELGARSFFPGSLSALRSIFIHGSLSRRAIEPFQRAMRPALLFNISMRLFYFIFNTKNPKVTHFSVPLKS